MMAGVDPSVENRIADLYAQEPGAFVAARTALAKELRAAGEREAATEVAGRRRPTLAAWALNQVGRLDPEGLEWFESAAETLRRAQERALSGDRTADLRAAVAERREAASRLVRSAAAALREIDRDPDPHLPAMAATIEAAAAADPEVGELLHQGRLSSEREAPGFDLTVVASVPRPARAARPAPKGQAVSKVTPKRAGRDDEARRAAADAARALKTAERNADTASAALVKARRRVEELDEKLRAARMALNELERAARSAQKELDAARRRHPAAGRHRDMT